MMHSRFFIVVVVLSAHAFAGNGEVLRSLHGMKGLSIKCDTEEKLSLVHSYEGHPNFDFLTITKILGNEIKVLVTADSLDEFTKVLIDNDIAHEVFIENVAKEAHDDFVSNELARRFHLKEGNDNRIFKYFPRYAEIQNYLQALAGKYSDVVKLLTIGSSYEGRPIYALKISSGPGDNKPAILVDAGIHAREWAAPTTALYAIEQLVVNRANSELYQKVDWYIIPSLNPDGYEFTHTSPFNRLWRKTRSRNPGTGCYGTDPNRNFGLKWMATGASSNPCSDIYAGKSAFSERETASLRDFVLANKNSIKVYLTIHSYGKYILHPWGFTSELPENEPELRKVAVAAEKAIASVQGTHYTIGSSTNVLYAAAGGSDDWVMGVAGIPLSYTIELPGGGNMGFNLPPSSIESVGIETFEAFKSFGQYVCSKYT